jgi:hypothetical protein
MPVFKFTSPEGHEVYGEGADSHEAFQAAEERSPNEIAAMRMRQSVRHGAETPHATDVPTSAGPEFSFQALARGEYPTLYNPHPTPREPGQMKGLDLPVFGEGMAENPAATLGGAAGLFVPPGLSMLGEAVSPTALAGGGMFDAEPDAKRRKAWEAQYNAAGAKGKREVLTAFNADQAKVQEANRRQQEAERGIAATERERTEGIQRRTDWERQNAEAIGKLAQTDRDTIKGAASLPEAQSLFGAAMERRRQAGMTLAERYPAAVLGGEALAVAGDIYAPFRLASGRAKALQGAAGDAEKAYLKAYGPGSKASKGTAAEAELRRNILQERTDLPSANMGELALGTATPYVAGNIPNAIDMLMGMLSSDPAAHEKVQRAWESASDPIQFLRSVGVGLGATALGSFAGGARHDIGSERARSQGILKQFAGRDATEAAKAEAAAARKRELAETKRVAAEARAGAKSQAELEAVRSQAGAEVGTARQAVADANKRAFAATAPTPAAQAKASQEAAAEAEAARVAAQKQAIRSLKAGGKKGGGALAPGAGGAAGGALE